MDYKNASQRIVLSCRLGIFLLILLVSLLTAVMQPGFINFNWLASFLFLLSVAFLEHLILVFNLDEEKPKLTWILASFCFDSILISALVHLSGLNQSLFLFLHLLNILLAGLQLQTKGALIVALMTSASFTFANLLGPELKLLNSVFLLALNNIAFFSVAGLSGYLADQLQFVGSELQKTGLSLQALRLLNEAIVENLPVGIVTFRADGEMVSYNRSFSMIAKGAAHQCLEEILSAVDFFRKDRSLVAQISSDVLRSTEDGQQVLFFKAEEINNPIDSKPLYLGIAEDLTSLRQLEYSARQNEKMAAVGGLAAGIAHEIRNPLAGISGSVELLSQTTTNDDDKKLMKIILREIDRLNNLITEFLEYSRPETAPSETVDLVSLINEVMDSLLLNKSLNQQVKQVRSLPSRANILGKRDKLKQALLNILINAYQAMPNPAEGRQIEVSLVQEAHSDSAVWNLKIIDNGSGMSEETRRRMFEPFHTTKSKGTGLGLAVTHKILEGHRAQIFVESKVQKGTEFHIRFPAQMTGS